MSIVLLGPPGSGKGTQAALLSGKLGLTAISTGEILREEVLNQTELGKKIKSHMDRGELVPDKVVVRVVREHLKKQKKGFILDGFPRNLAQAYALKEILEEMGQNLERVLYFEVDQEELVKRLSQRRTCLNCGQVYHLIFGPPQNEDLCDLCGGRLYQREDDSPSAVRRRLEVYMKETTPLISYYEKESILRVIKGEGSPREVNKEIQKIF